MTPHNKYIVTTIIIKYYNLFDKEKRLIQDNFFRQKKFANLDNWSHLPQISNLSETKRATFTDAKYKLHVVFQGQTDISQYTMLIHGYTLKK